VKFVPCHGISVKGLTLTRSFRRGKPVGWESNPRPPFIFVSLRVIILFRISSHYHLCVCCWKIELLGGVLTKFKNKGRLLETRICISSLRRWILSLQKHKEYNVITNEVKMCVCVCVCVCVCPVQMSQSWPKQTVSLLWGGYISAADSTVTSELNFLHSFIYWICNSCQELAKTIWHIVPQQLGLTWPQASWTGA
jgi:hypothetical protein